VVKLWCPQTAQLLATLKGHKGAISALAFAPDGKTLASGSEDRTINLWEVKK
jgi:WD40 repeat protein